MSELKVVYQPHADVYDPWAALGRAVIRQAAMEYRRYGKMLLTCEDEDKRRSLSEEMKEISRFFLSNWYCVLSGDNNGPDILARLDEEAFGIDECP